MCAELDEIVTRVRALAEAEEWEAVVQACHGALRDCPRAVELWWQLSYAHRQTGHPEESAQALYHHMRLVPDLECPRLILVHDLVRLGRIDEAAGLLREAISGEPDRVLWWQELGRTYESVSRWNEAAEAFEQAT